jgi:hypothetical protein
MHASRALTHRGRVRARREFLISEVGAGSVMALAVVASCVTLAGVLLPFVGFVVVHERAQSISDRAALTAASAVYGLVTGDPCTRAADVISEVSTTSWSCVVLGDAFISMSIPFGPVHMSVRSRAGL